MKAIAKLHARILRNTQKGLTTVEYAVAGGVIAAGLVALFKALGGNVSTIITNISTALGG